MKVGVIGGSMSGLLAARALSEHVREVHILERDPRSSRPLSRKSVPQGEHAHVLLAKGAQLLDEWFTDLFQSLEAQGGLLLDMSFGNNWYHFGTWKRRFDAKVPVHFQSRVLLEHEVRNRVLSLPNVQQIRASVPGVSWASGLPEVQLEGESAMTFDLLIDASGRGSKFPQWIHQAGYPEAIRERVIVDVSYTSARYRPGQARDFGGLLLYPHPPSEKRAGGILPIEGGEVLVSLFGWCGEQAEPNDENMLDFARSLPQPEIAQFLETAERTSEYRVYHYKQASRWRTDRATHFPPRTCITGDSLCSVDPVFGQGMTLAALEARLLAQCVKEHPDDPERVARTFRAGAIPVTETAWMLSTGEDLRYPEVRGKRPLGLGLSHWYTKHIHRLAAHDEEVYRRFARVMNLLEGPSTLFHPSVAAKVFRASWSKPKAVLDRPRGANRSVRT